MQPLYGKKKSIWIWVIAFTIVIFLIWNPGGSSNSVRGFIQHIFSPLSASGTNLGTSFSRNIYVFTHLQDLRDEAESQKREVYALTARLATLDHIAKENEELRRIVDLPIITSDEPLAADVIMRNISGDTQVLINRGTKDGVQIGDIVVTADDALVGTINSVSDSKSYVRLSIDPESSFSVVKSGTTQSAVARGANGAAITVNHIPTNTEVNVGDTFLYHDSRNADAYKRKLSIGTVQEVIMDDDRLSQTARLFPLYDSRKLTHVFILQTNP